MRRGKEPRQVIMRMFRQSAAIGTPILARQKTSGFSSTQEARDLSAQSLSRSFSVRHGHRAERECVGILRGVSDTAHQRRPLMPDTRLKVLKTNYKMNLRRRTQARP